MMTLPDTYSNEEKLELERQFEVLLQSWTTRKNEQDLESVREAFLLAANAHKDQRRRSGEPYMYHPLAVATIIAGEMGMGRTSIIAALLHDVVEDTDYTVDDLKELFGEKIASLVEGPASRHSHEIASGVCTKERKPSLLWVVDFNENAVWSRPDAACHVQNVKIPSDDSLYFVYYYACTHVYSSKWLRAPKVDSISRMLFPPIGKLSVGADTIGNHRLIILNAHYMFVRGR